MNITKRHFIGALVGAGMTAAALIPAAVAAQTNMPGNSAFGHEQGMQDGDDHRMAPGSRPAMRPGIAGTVTSVSGTTLTVASRGFGKDAATTTYSVNASAATVRKDNATSTLSSVVAGDFVFIQGTVSGTNVTATSIMDGKLGMRGDMEGRGPGWPGDGPHASTTPQFQGNGQPIVAGTIATVNGNALTITTKSGTTYSIDAAAAKVTKGGASITASNIAIGDQVVVQGAVNGTSVTASTIIDGQAGNKGPGQSGQPKPQSHGFFGAIGGFFMHIFGF